MSFTLSHNNKVKEYKSQRGKSWPWYETCHWVALFQILQFWSKRQISRKGGMNGKKHLSVVWKQTANTDVGPQFRSDIDSNGYTVQHKGEGKKGGHLEQVEYKGVFHYSENVDVEKVKAWNPSLKGHIMNSFTFSRGNLVFPMEDKVSLCEPTRTKLLVRTALGPPGLATTTGRADTVTLLWLELKQRNLC